MGTLLDQEVIDVKNGLLFAGLRWSNFVLENMAKSIVFWRRVFNAR